MLNQFFLQSDLKASEEAQDVQDLIDGVQR
jgi:hypothetical protein